MQSDIENCEGWLSPGGHSSGGRALTAKFRGPQFNPRWLLVFHSSLKIFPSLSSCTYVHCCRGKQSFDQSGVGAVKPAEVKKEDDEFDLYRKRMMLAYRFRPNPLVSATIPQSHCTGSMGNCYYCPTLWCVCVCVWRGGGGGGIVRHSTIPDILLNNYIAHVLNLMVGTKWSATLDCDACIYP